MYARRCLAAITRAVPRARHMSLPAHTKVAMPALSPTMKTGTIARWNKKEGEAIAPGDAICDVETDKAVVTFEAQDDAVLAKILRPDGSADIAVGDIIAITVDSASDVAAFKDYKPTAQTASPAPAPAPQAAAPAPAPKPAPAPAPVVPAPAPQAPVAAAPAPAPKPAALPASSPAASAPAVASGDSYVAFEAWGSSLKKTPLASSLGRQQRAYAALYGFSGFDPIPAPESEKPAASDAKPAKKAYT